MSNTPTLDQLPFNKLLTGVVKEADRSKQVIEAALELITEISTLHDNSQELRSHLETHLNSIHEKHESLPEARITTNAERFELDVAQQAIVLIDKTFTENIYDFLK